MDLHSVRQRSSNPRVAYYPAGGIPQTGDNDGFTAAADDTLFAVPFLCVREETIIRLAIYNKTTGGSGAARIGLYENEDMMPSTIIPGTDLGVLTCTVAGVKEHTMELVLEPNLYWAVCVFDNIGASQILGLQRPNAIPWLGHIVGTDAPGLGWKHAYTYAALPAVFPTSSLTKITGTGIPGIYMRFEDA